MIALQEADLLEEPIVVLDHPASTDCQPTLAQSLDELLVLVNGNNSLAALDTVVRISQQHIPGVHCASVTALRGAAFRTVAATGGHARRIDLLQHQDRCGPCVETAWKCHVAHIPDTLTDTQWPIFGRRVATECGVGSVLSYRIIHEELHGAITSLNLYSKRRGAFHDVHRGGVTGQVAAACALAVSAVMNRDSAATATQGLDSNRVIGMAIGVIMYAYKVSPEVAFELLRAVSQRQNRKLRDVAAEVSDTGVLEIADTPRSIAADDRKLRSAWCRWA